MTELVLDNAQLWYGDGRTDRGHVVVCGDRIGSVAAGRYTGQLPTEDLQGQALSPGLVDLMLLGGFGVSIVDGDLLQIARRSVRMGVTAIQFCGGMLGWEANGRVAQNVRRAMTCDDAAAAKIVGWYPEGPFEHPEMTGGALAKFAYPPSPANVQRMLDEMGDTFAMINVSPGTDGDVDAIRAFREAGKFVSMAHSKASAEHTVMCIEAGTTILGHVLCNNNGVFNEFGRPVPTIDDVALADERVRFIHMICDAVHVEPMFMRRVLRCRGTEALCLVTDGHPCIGCPDGPFAGGDGRTFAKRGTTAYTEDGCLVGSAMMVADHFRNFVKHTQTAPHDAIRCVTHNPAESIGLGEQMGLLAPGRNADLVLWDDQLQIQRVWRAGQEVAAVSDLAEVCL